MAPGGGGADQRRWAEGGGWRADRPSAATAAGPVDVVVLAQANKTARIAWAVLSKGDARITGDQRPSPRRLATRRLRAARVKDDVMA
jgi:hypothetical protein